MLKKFKITLSVVLAIFFSTPHAALAKVSINEIAWMGTTLTPASKGQYCEWIELYNDGNSAVDLAGVTLYKDGGQTPIIALTKKIEPGGYYLIERVTNSCPDPVPGFNDDSGSFGGGGLGNLGEYLVLKATAGDPFDSIDVATGWSAGDNSTKQTMQKSGSTWITATGTPRAVNTSVNAVVDPVTTSTTNSSNSSNSNSSTDEGFTNLSAHSSSADLSTKVEEVKIFASAGRNRLAIVGTPVSFEERLFNSKSEELDGGNISWSFGDGYFATGKVAAHAYKFPGDYAVVMNVLKNAENYVARTNVRVVPAEITIADATPEFVKIRNRSDYEANLGDWSLVSDKSGFVFPRDTIVLAKKDITIAIEATGLNSNFEQIKLISPAKKTVSVFIVHSNVENQKPNSSTHLPAPVVVRAVSQDGDSQSNSVSDSTASVLLGLQQQLLEARKSLDLMTPKVPKIVAISMAEVPAEDQIKIPVIKEDTGISEPVAIQIIEKPKSIFKTLLDVPVNGYRYLKSFIF